MAVAKDQTDQPTGTAVFLPGPAHSLHRNPNFRRHRLARTVSVVGATATYLVLPVLAYQLTASSLWSALVVVAGSLPYLGGALLAGAVAGRPAWRHSGAGPETQRRRLLVAADVANAALLASLPIAFTVDALTATHVLIVAFMAQALYVFFDAANVSTPPFRLRPGTALQLTAPALAGVLLVVTAVPPLLTVDTVSLIVSALLIRAVATPPQAITETAIPGPRQPWRFPTRRPLVHVQTIVFALQAAAGGAFLGQFAPWLDQDLGVRPVRDARLGLLLVALGIGARLATGVLPRAADRFGGRRVKLYFLPGSALCGLACVLAPHWTLAFLALVAWAVAYLVVVLDAPAPGGLGRKVPFGLGWPAGALVGGLTAAAYGPRSGVAAAVAMIAVAALVVWVPPLQRRLFTRTAPRHLTEP